MALQIITIGFCLTKFYLQNSINYICLALFAWKALFSVKKVSILSRPEGIILAEEDSIRWYFMHHHFGDYYIMNLSQIQWHNMGISTWMFCIIWSGLLITYAAHMVTDPG